MHAFARARSGGCLMAYSFWRPGEDSLAVINILPACGYIALHGFYVLSLLR